MSPEASAAAVLGVAQVPMRTRLPDTTYDELLATVAMAAVEDAGLQPEDIDGLLLAQAPTTTLGVDEPHLWGMAGLPGSHRFLGRVHVAAASGLAAFRLAAGYVRAGRRRNVLIVAADLADEGSSLRGALAQMHDPFTSGQASINAITAAGLQASHYMAAHGVSERTMASVVVKNRANGVLNPYAQLRKAITVDEVIESPPLSWPIKRMDSSPRTSGAAAIIVGRAPTGKPKRAIGIGGYGSYSGGRSIGAQVVPGSTAYLDGSELAQAAHRAFAAAGVTGPTTQIGLAEVYASFGIFELLGIEALGFCGSGEAARRIEAGEFHRAAALPVNASGGATCANPISASGLLRIVEATTQLRGEAGERQVELKAPWAVVSAIGGLFQTHEVGVLEA
jgi:acetyl-CoA C-acetyltransferase